MIKVSTLRLLKPLYGSKPQNPFLPFNTLLRCALPVLAGLLFIVWPGRVKAQTVTISYPSGAAAQPLTRGYSSSILTVRLSYSATCSGSTVTIALPTGIQYVIGSISKTAGTGGAASTTITEGSVTNTRRPVFTVNNVSGAGDLTFTISRIANCGSTSSGKDSIYITGSCGSATENNGSLNTYTIFSPAPAQTGPTAITNAYINDVYSRTFRITNGGNGCLDTLLLAIKRPVSSISGATLKIGSTTVTPYATIIDTSFYKISGANLPGGDNLMCNGEFIDFTEQFTLLNCASLSTTYLVSWGRPGSICAVTSATGTITMGSGITNISGGIVRSQQLNWCQPGVFTITLTNGGSGNKAGAAYNLLPNIGYNGSGNTTTPGGITTSTRGRIDSFKVNSVTVPIIAATATTSAKANFSGMTTDPDGANVGIDDLDGDGQYDDLLPGKSVVITVYEHWDNSAAPACPTPIYNFYNSYNAGYSTMCGTAFTTNPLTATNLGSYRILANNGGILTAPAEIVAGTPFPVQACVNLSSYSSPFAPVDSLYFDIIFPTGLTAAPTPNITYNGVAVPASGYYIDTVLGVRTLHVRRKGRAAAFCFSASLIYDCTGGTTIIPQFNIRYQGDTCSQSIDYHMCKTASIKVSCPAPCAEGIRNYLPVAKRLTLGYTDATMTTKVLPSVVTGLAAYTALPLDTIQIIVTGKQATLLGSYNNLYYNLQFGRVSSTDVFQFVSGTFNQLSGASTTSNAMGMPTAASTSTLQKLSWNLSSNLNNTTISNGDSVWLDLRFAVTRAGSDALYGNTLTQVPNTSSTLYNRTLANIAVGCDTAHAINLLVTGNASPSGFTPATSISNCSAVNITSSEYFGNATGPDIFPDEYRPQVIIDSVSVDLPTGYILSPSFNQYVYKYWNTLLTYASNPVVTTGIITQNTPTAWTIKNPNITTGGWGLADLGNTGMANYTLTYQVLPTCASVTGTQSYPIRWYYRDFVYTGNAANYVSKSRLENTTLTYNATVVPALSLQNNTGVVQGTLPQHYWDVQINSTGTGTPLNVWMALDRLSSSITIDSVIYNGSNISASGISYATNKVWYQLSATGFTSKAARIYFKYTSCSADSIKMLTGWNCSGYPSPDPSANVCSEIAQYLKVIPQSSQVQLSLLRQPGNGNGINLCTGDSVTIIVNSALGANVDNPRVSVTPVAGLSIVTPVPVEYPLGSGNWQNLAATFSAGVYTINLEDHTGIGPAGLKGVIAAGGVSANRQAKVVIQYQTSCTFTANNFFSFNVYGATPCGDIAIGNGNRVNSDGVTINGATVSGSATMNISSAATDLSCGDAASTVSLTVTPLGGVSTTSGDVTVCNLPAGLVYVPNSFSNISNCTGCTLTTAAGTGGGTDLSVALDPGIASGSNITFSIQVLPGSGCGANVLAAEMHRNTSTISCGGTTCGTTQAIIASASQSIVIRKPQLDIISLMSTNVCSPGSGYRCTYDLLIKNNGNLTAPANTYKAEFFCGNSTLLYTYTILSAIPANTSIVEPIYFYPPSSCAGQPIKVKISLVTTNNVSQCLCSESSYQMASILPVKLLSFNGVLKNAAINFTWKATNEVNMKRYTVERSIDGLHYIPLANILARNSTGINTYSMHDNNLPAGINVLYYRLKMEDASGIITYSEVITIRPGTSIAENIIINPNPVRNVLSVTLPVNISLAQVRFLNALGQVIMNESVNSGMNILNTAQLRAGVYLLQIISNRNVVHNEKIIKE